MSENVLQKIKIANAEIMDSNKICNSSYLY